MYTLEEWVGDERPWRIKTPAGEVLFSMIGKDRRHAEEILTALNSGETLTPDDDLADAA